MPCYDGRDSLDSIRFEVKEKLKQEYLHDSPVAEMLCKVLGNTPEQVIFDLPKEIRQWWAEHQLRDLQKEGRELEVMINHLQPLTKEQQLDYDSRILKLQAKSLEFVNQIPKLKLV